MSKSSMPGLIIAVLAITAFAAGLSEFIVIGMLSQVATEFGVTMPQVGLLVTAYALGITLGSPLLTALTLSYSARSLAVILMLLFSILSAGSAVISDFTVLLILRVVAGAIHGAYFSITSASLPTVTDARQTPLAIALMFSGLTLAMVLGVPAGMVAAVHYGWQAPFVAIAIVAAAGAALLWFVLPAKFGPPIVTRHRASVFRSTLSNPTLIRPYCFTVLAFGGGFVFFSYAEPWLADAVGLEPRKVVLIMGAVGLGSLVGNIMGGILPGKIGLPAALTFAVFIQIAGLLGVFYAVGSANSSIFLVLWSIGAFATAPMVQSWAIADAETSDARVSASLNVSAFNLGMSLSSFIATRQVAADGMTHLPLTAAFLVMLAIPFGLFHRRTQVLRCPLFWRNKMFKWTYSESVTTEATPEQIWAMWQDASSWPCWDSELKWVKLNGDFTEGTTGRMKPASGPEVDFTLSRVEFHRAFTDVAKLPLTNLVFDHEYFSSREAGVPAHICHSVTMTGWLAPVFGRLIGSKIKNHLREAMTELSQRALTGDKTVR